MKALKNVSQISLGTTVVEIIQLFWIDLFFALRRTFADIYLDLIQVPNMDHPCILVTGPDFMVMTYKSDPRLNEEIVPIKPASIQKLSSLAADLAPRIRVHCIMIFSDDYFVWGRRCYDFRGRWIWKHAGITSTWPDGSCGGVFSVRIHSYIAFTFAMLSCDIYKFNF